MPSGLLGVHAEIATLPQPACMPAWSHLIREVFRSHLRSVLRAKASSVARARIIQLRTTRRARPVCLVQMCTHPRIWHLRAALTASATPNTSMSNSIPQRLRPASAVLWARSARRLARPSRRSPYLLATTASRRTRSMCADAMMRRRTAAVQAASPAAASTAPRRVAGGDRTRALARRRFQMPTRHAMTSSVLTPSSAAAEPAVRCANCATTQTQVLAGGPM